MGAAALFVIAAKLPGTARAERQPVDVLGAVLLTAAASAIVLVTSWGGTEYAWDSPTILALAAVAVAALGGFLVQERRAADPVVPLRLFANRAFSAAGLSAFMVGMAMFGAITFLPLYLQVVDGASATVAGLRMLPVVIGALLASTISGRLISTAERYKPYPVAGALLMATGLLLLSGLDERSSDVLAAVYMLILGLGVGLVMQVVILVAQNNAPRRHIGVATSTATFSRAIGASIGVALFGAIFATRLSSELASLGPAGRAHRRRRREARPRARAGSAGVDQAAGHRRLRQRPARDVPGGRRLRAGRGGRGDAAAAGASRRAGRERRPARPWHPGRSAGMKGSASRGPAGGCARRRPTHLP